MMSFPCPLCPCPKSKLLVFYSNFFSAIHTRTVELKPREDIHTGTEGNDLTRMVEACHLWGSLVTECPSHWSRGSRKGKSQMNDMPLVRAGPRHGLNERLLVSSLRKGGSVVAPHGNGGTGYPGLEPFEQFGTALDLGHHDTHIRQWPKVRARPNFI